MAEEYIPKIGDTFIAINKETGIEARVGPVECINVHFTKSGSLQYVEAVDRYIYNDEWSFKRIKKTRRIAPEGLS